MLHRIVDEAYVCHIAFGSGEDTHCIPTAHWRRGDYLYIHGSNGSRMIKALAAGTPASVAMTLLDGLVLARSAFNHSMNYRSAVIYGRFEMVEGSVDKLAALDALMDKIAPGRRHDARPGNEKEINATSVLRIALAEAAVKVSDSMPSDKDEDLALAVWTGILPLKMTRGAPVHAEGSVPVPDYVRNWEVSCTAGPCGFAENGGARNVAPSCVRTATRRDFAAGSANTALPSRRAFHSARCSCVSCGGCDSAGCGCGAGACSGPVAAALPRVPVVALRCAVASLLHVLQSLVAMLHGFALALLSALCCCNAALLLLGCVVLLHFLALLLLYCVVLLHRLALLLQLLLGGRTIFPRRALHGLLPLFAHRVRRMLRRCLGMRFVRTVRANAPGRRAPGRASFAPKCGIVIGTAPGCCAMACPRMPAPGCIVLRSIVVFVVLLVTLPP